MQKISDYQKKLFKDYTDSNPVTKECKEMLQGRVNLLDLNELTRDYLNKIASYLNSEKNDTYYIILSLVNAYERLLDNPYKTEGEGEKQLEFENNLSRLLSVLTMPQLGKHLDLRLNIKDHIMTPRMDDDGSIIDFRPCYDFFSLRRLDEIEDKLRREGSSEDVRMRDALNKLHKGKE